MTAYLRLGNAAAFFAALAVVACFWCLVSLFLIALVFFGRRSSGRYLDPASCDLMAERRSWEMTVSTRATPLRTDLILTSLFAAPPVTLATWSAASSCLRSLSCFFLFRVFIFDFYSKFHFSLSVSASVRFFLKTGGEGRREGAKGKGGRGPAKVGRWRWCFRFGALSEQKLREKREARAIESEFVDSAFLGRGRIDSTLLLLLAWRTHWRSARSALI